MKSTSAPLVGKDLKAMPKIIQEGCVANCGYCQTKFSFTPNEAHVSFKQVPAGYSPEEEAYKKAQFDVSCPKCHRSVDIGDALGSAAKREAEQHAREAQKHGDYD